MALKTSALSTLLKDSLLAFDCKHKIQFEISQVINNESQQGTRRKIRLSSSQQWKLWNSQVHSCIVIKSLKLIIAIGHC